MGDDPHWGESRHSPRQRFGFPWRERSSEGTESGPPARGCIGRIRLGFRELRCDGTARRDALLRGLQRLHQLPLPGSDRGPINPGLPNIAEGADEHWYGIRIDNPTTGGSLDGDLAVQKVGGGTNLTPVGRVEDEAGIAFHINTIGLTSSMLDFDWRTFSASGSDRLRAGYFVDSIPAFASSDYFDARSTPYAWASWTPLLSGQSDTFHHATYALPNNQASLWVVFWLDNGEGDYGKVDNVRVTAAPEPSAAALVVLAGALVAARRHRSV